MKKHYAEFSTHYILKLILKSSIAAFLFCFTHTASLAQTADTLRPLLFVENPDNFPANDRFVFSRVQIPWSRADSNFNANHDSLTVRIRNKGTKNLTISNIVLSNDSTWKLVKLKGSDFVPGSSLPLTLAAGAFADLTVQFIAVDAGTRVAILKDTLTITSNDSKFPLKPVYLSGIWQKQGEGSNEPYLQEIITAFQFTTNTGFGHTDPDLGDTTKLKGDEIKPSFFVRADTSRPVQIRQISAYHGCCTQTERIAWYPKGSSTTLTNILIHLAKDAQSVLPRKNGSSTAAATATFTPSEVFGLKTGYNDNTDATKNPGKKTGIRVLKALDADSNIIPNSYIISNDYLGTSSTNYDYNDNTYFVSNIKPAAGASYYSALKASPSDIDFGENISNTSTSFNLKISSLGQVYADSSKDPVIKIDSIVKSGENSSEFDFVAPVTTTLNPQDSTAITVKFNPVTQGLKIADLLIYHDNYIQPVRVPLYGTSRATDITVITNYRINSGSATPITLNGKTWAADNQYAHDNIEPYTNPRLHEIAGTDEDSLYLKEQSSNGDKKPFRYEFPLENGDYVVRLHFAEIYWGATGSGLNGGVGSRIMNISLEDLPRLVNFDVTGEVGAATALVKNLPVTVTDGKLDISFGAGANRPMVVAVEVLSFRRLTVMSSVTVPEVYIPTPENKLKKPRVYPNPAQKQFRVQFPSEYSGSFTLQIADAAGRTYNIGTLELQRSGSKTAQVDVSGLGLKPGVCYLRIVSETRPADVIKLVTK